MEGGGDRVHELCIPQVRRMSAITKEPSGKLVHVLEPTTMHGCTNTYTHIHVHVYLFGGTAKQC